MHRSRRTGEYACGRDDTGDARFCRRYGTDQAGALRLNARKTRISGGMLDVYRETHDWRRNGSQTEERK